MRTVQIEAGRIYIYPRDGIYQARIRMEGGQYIWRSLKTDNADRAVEKARDLFHSLRFRQQNGFPLATKSFNSAIDEYVELRELQHRQGRTSFHMLRQIRRVVKFWREYLGARPIDMIENRDVAGYVEWRKEYYYRLSLIPRNARLNPTDKTLQWEITLGKAILKWAHERGYRGTKPLPSFSFVPKKKRVRPAFEIHEYRRLLRTLLKWQRECPNSKWLQSRKLLSDYVLVLASSGMRVGEANNLRRRDVEQFEDDLGRRNYRFKVNGKTGERDVILRASAAKSVDRLLRRRETADLNDWLFAMPSGSKIITLIDQFDKVLLLGGIARNSHGDKFTLYSLRHFYAVQSLRRGIGIFELSRNMGTSVQVLQSYYAKHATPRKLATQLGG